MRRALEAGKHVLSQKPFALDVADARRLVDEAERRGLRLAVNQNGRWAPAWRIATLLVQQGAIGDVCAVTHLYEHDFGWTVGDWPDELEHFVIYDFSAHWIDISRCWLEAKTPRSSRRRSTTRPRAAGREQGTLGRLDPVTSTTMSRARRSGAWGPRRSGPATRSGSTAGGRFAAACARARTSSSSSAVAS